MAAGRHHIHKGLVFVKPLNNRLKVDVLTFFGYARILGRMNAPNHGREVRNKGQADLIGLRNSL
jgi:hypothetical protein